MIEISTLLLGVALGAFGMVVFCIVVGLVRDYPARMIRDLLQRRGRND